jgi:hypothetical protein
MTIIDIHQSALPPDTSFYHQMNVLAFMPINTDNDGTISQTEFMIGCSNDHVRGFMGGDTAAIAEHVR